MKKTPPSLRTLRAELHAVANPKTAEVSQWFFKTGPGQYGEGDRFLGIKVPVLRKTARQFNGLPLRDIEQLLESEWHEERMAALFLLVDAFEKSGEKQREKLYRFYLRSTKRINNWDLVDLSAPNIVGTHLLHRPRSLLKKLARSNSLWERRIAIVSTFAFIRNHQFDDTLAVCEILLEDTHDLIHKACGWMLREVYKKSPSTLEDFLKRHAKAMPRTMLRYSIERMPEAKRQKWLAVKGSR